VLGRRKAVVDAKEKFYKQAIADGVHFVTRLADNFQTVQSAHGNWRKAQQQIVVALDRKVNDVN
jgi:hypothetical protein